VKFDVEGAELDVIGDLADAEKFAPRQADAGRVSPSHRPHPGHVFTVTRLLEENGFGYQIEGHIDRPLLRERTQDARLYGYRKSQPAQVSA
jgi:hypothetical protein